MRNFHWKAFMTKEEAITFCKSNDKHFHNTCTIYNVKTEMKKLSKSQYSDCLAVYQGVDSIFNWVVQWVERI